ncbi:MAG: hypothetical protein HY280_02710 [Nitrospinae bacterium]|nr:hypothetical protein [Nitrospinota bacterium]
MDKAANFSIHEGKATLAFPADQMLARDQCEEDRALIEVEMEKILGKKTYLSLATSAKEPVGEKVEAEAKKTDYERKVRKDMLNHPMIQKAVEIFDGTPGFEEDSPKGG